MYDVIVIGAGPAGLSAALVLGRQRRSVLLLDHARPRNAPAGEMHMVLSRDGIDPADYRALGRADLAPYSSVESREAAVTDTSGEAGDFRVELADGTVERARRLILATGQVDEPYDIPGLAELWGTGVLHCPYCHGWESTGKTLAVIARSPVEASLAVYVADRFSDDVVLCTDGPLELPERLANGAAERGVRTVAARVVELSGKPGALTLRFDDGSELDREAVFHRAPTRQHAGFAARLGAELNEDGTVRVDEYQHTTIPGLAAAGDLAKQPGMSDATTLVALGAADGVRAAVWMDGMLFRDSLTGA